MPSSVLGRIGAPVLYLAGALLLWRHFNFIYYKDELSYLSAAAKYARLELAAVNSYWSPLLSMQLAPFLALGAPPALAADIVKVLNGLFALEGGRALIRTLGSRGWLAHVLDVVLVLVTLACAMPFLSADLLLAGILSTYFSLVLRRDYAARRWTGVAAGVLGGLAYYAKQYGFFFFASHFVLVSALHWWLGDPSLRAGVLRQLRNGLLVFAAMSLAWMGALYAKYHQVTLGLTGTYNHQIVGPDAADRPILQIGFDADPRPGNTSVWEDPVDFYTVPSALACCLKPWSPLDSRRAFVHQLRLIASNTSRTLEQFRIFTHLGEAVILLSAVLCLCRLADARRRLPLVLALATLALYPSGYLLVYADDRYLWPMLYLLVAMSGHLLMIGAATPLLADPRRQVLVASAVALTFVKVPTSRVLAARDVGRSTSQFVEALRDLDLRGARLASNADYGASDIIAFHGGASYIGQRAPRDSTAALLSAALRRARIDYYLVWGGAAVAGLPPGFEVVRDVTIVPEKRGPTRLGVVRVPR